MKARTTFKTLCAFARDRRPAIMRKQRQEVISLRRVETALRNALIESRTAAARANNSATEGLVAADRARYRR